MSPQTLKIIGAIVGPEKRETLAVVRELHDWCKACGIEMRAFGDIADSADCARLMEENGELRSDVDLIVVLGGDGTMLGAARLIGKRQVPVLGVNFGWLGYLTEFTLDELFVALDNIREGRYSSEQRMMLDVSLQRSGRTIASHQALNDAVINKAEPARMIELECMINGMFVNSFRADGMIIATPTGSTAYSLSAGGPVWPPRMSAFLFS